MISKLFGVSDEKITKEEEEKEKDETAEKKEDNVIVNINSNEDDNDALGLDGKKIEVCSRCLSLSLSLLLALSLFLSPCLSFFFPFLSLSCI